MHPLRLKSRRAYRKSYEMRLQRAQKEFRVQKRKSYVQLFWVIALFLLFFVGLYILIPASFTLPLAVSAVGMLCAIAAFIGFVEVAKRLWRTDRRVDQLNTDIEALKRVREIFPDR